MKFKYAPMIHVCEIYTRTHYIEWSNVFEQADWPIWAIWTRQVFQSFHINMYTWNNKKQRREEKKHTSSCIITTYSTK